MHLLPPDAAAQPQSAAATALWSERPMRTAKSLSNPWSTTALVAELDDTALKSGHALLDQLRAEEFCQWIDGQLEELEARFREYSTYGSIRLSLGR